ncbi:MAG TPA: transglutaminase-like domain-containing protein [Verrucomicrobiota bacterium]|nr:transglutaminase-like domain-containing protein [Verrucomicrobiota bacterium]
MAQIYQNIARKHSLTEKERTALIKLLDDEDPNIYSHIRQKLIECGPEICKLLKQSAIKGSPLLRKRANEIVNFFGKKDADNIFLAFCLTNGDDLDLENGVFLLAKTQYPDINQEAYSALIDNFAFEIGLRLKRITRAVPIINTVNNYLFDDLGFVGNEVDYYNPNNNYLNIVLDKRTGNPVSLCALYILITQRLKLPVAGIALPGHFMCRFQTPTEEFYIDVFNRGRILTKADCIRYLHDTSHSIYDGYLSPVKPRNILLRLCSNLHKVYQRKEQHAQAGQYQRYLIVLSR